MFYKVIAIVALIATVCTAFIVSQAPYFGWYLVCHGVVLVAFIGVWKLLCIAWDGSS